MQLLVLSDYGSQEKLKKGEPSEADVIKTMESIDWNFFHQVVLSKNDNDWIEVGGNLNKDGLSVLYEKNNEQFVIDEAPTSINQLTEILLSYFKNDSNFKIKYKFSGETNNSDVKYDANKVYNQIIEKERIKNHKKNEAEKYELMEMIELFLFAPYYFIKGSSRFMSFLELKNENYKLKLLQKVLIYGLSITAWYLILIYFSQN